MKATIHAEAMDMASKTAHAVYWRKSSRKIDQYISGSFPDTNGKQLRILNNIKKAAFPVKLRIIPSTKRIRANNVHFTAVQSCIGEWMLQQEGTILKTTDYNKNAGVLSPKSP